MTRREFEEIKEEYRKYTKRTICIEAYDDIVQLLIQVLENGGIEEEPDEPELIPCPFCPAGTSALEFEYLEGVNRGRYLCHDADGGCGASAGYTEYNISDDYKTVKQRAADKWNARATTPTEPPKVDDDYFRIFGEQMGGIYREFRNGFRKTFMED